MPRTALLALAFLLTTAACGRRGRDGDASSVPLDRPVAQTEVFHLTVHRVASQQKHLRIWVTLTNRSDEQVQVSYGDFEVEIGGATYPAPLYIFPVTRTNEFPMSPTMVKKFGGPLQALSVPTEGACTLRLTRYRGTDGEHQPANLEVKVPLVNYDWK